MYDFDQWYLCLSKGLWELPVTYFCEWSLDCYASLV